MDCVLCTINGINYITPRDYCTVNGTAVTQQAVTCPTPPVVGNDQNNPVVVCQFTFDGRLASVITTTKNCSNLGGTSVGAPNADEIDQFVRAHNS
jgi:hypothetical protein